MDFLPEFLAWSGGVFQMVAGIAAVLFLVLDRERAQRRRRRNTNLKALSRTGRSK